MIVGPIKIRINERVNVQLSLKMFLAVGYVLTHTQNNNYYVCLRCDVWEDAENDSGSWVLDE